MSKQRNKPALSAAVAKQDSERVRHDGLGRNRLLGLLRPGALMSSLVEKHSCKCAQSVTHLDANRTPS